MPSTSENFIDYYKILDLSHNVDITAIKKQYKKKAREIHPDKSLNANATAAMQVLNKAYEVLSDEQERKIYDQQLDNFVRQQNETKQNETEESDYNSNNTEDNEKSHPIILTNPTVKKLNSLLSEISFILTEIKSFNFKTSTDLDTLKRFNKNIVQKREKFNSLNKRLSWVLENCGPHVNKEVYFSKKLIANLKVADKLSDASTFLFFQKIKINCIDDNQFLVKMISDIPAFFVENKIKFKGIAFEFLKIKKEYQSMHKFIKDLDIFQFENLINEINNLFKIKTNLIQKIDKIIVIEDLVKKQQTENVIADEQDNLRTTKNDKEMPKSATTNDIMNDYLTANLQSSTCCDEGIDACAYFKQEINASEPIINKQNNYHSNNL